MMILMSSKYSTSVNVLTLNSVALKECVSEIALLENARTQLE